MRVLVDGQPWMIHFHHAHVGLWPKPRARWSHVTVATLHRAPCPEGRVRGRPCPARLDRVAVGLAKCSWDDAFNRRTGRRLALTRAMDGVLSRDQRRQVWTQYHQAFPGQKEAVTP